MNCSWGSFWHLGEPIFWTIALIIIALLVWDIIFCKKNRMSSGLLCHSCNGRIDHAFMRCPNCGTELKSHCPKCSKIVENTWAFCPACSTTLKNKNELLET